MAKALYRKYRSRGFDEVVGQEHITDTLQRAIDAGTYSHAYLFTGPRGVGKTSIARILAHAVNALPYSDDQHLDIIEIDAASNRRIDDIRDLREKIFITPSSLKHKIYIIDEVHMLTGESFNALLKTLEEPPEHAIFILATTELHKLPATVVSRTQRFHFKPVEISKVVAHLRMIANKESISIDDEALHLIAERGEGSFRDSISLLDQLSSLEANPITSRDVEALLGLASKAEIDTLVGAIDAYKLEDARTALDSLLASGVPVASLHMQIVKQITQKAVDSTKWYTLLDQLIDVPRSYYPELKLTALLMLAASRSHHHSQAEDIPQPKPKSAALRVAMPVVHEVKKPLTTPPKSTEKPKVIDTVTSQNMLSQSFSWPEILAIAKKKSPPLHSVLAKAEQRLDSDALYLTFRYSLHRKKLDDTRYRTQLVNIITETYGECPEIITIVASKSPSSGQAADVAAIMGGGESVNV